jgi:hypothetical protein
VRENDPEMGRPTGLEPVTLRFTKLCSRDESMTYAIPSYFRTEGLEGSNVSRCGTSMNIKRGPTTYAALTSVLAESILVATKRFSASIQEFRRVLMPHPGPVFFFLTSLFFL